MSNPVQAFKSAFGVETPPMRGGKMAQKIKRIERLEMCLGGILDFIPKLEQNVQKGEREIFFRDLASIKIRIMDALDNKDIKF